MTRHGQPHYLDKWGPLGSGLDEVYRKGTVHHRSNLASADLCLTLKQCQFIHVIPLRVGALKVNIVLFELSEKECKNYLTS